MVSAAHMSLRNIASWGCSRAGHWPEYSAAAEFAAPVWCLGWVLQSAEVELQTAASTPHHSGIRV